MDNKSNSRPEVEKSRAAGVPPDTQSKQLNIMDKVTRDVSKNIARERDEMDNKSNSRPEVEKTQSPDDTAALLAAINHGKGLKESVAPLPTRVSQAPVQQPTMPKAPSTIKTNIKAANQVHPYQR